MEKELSIVKAWIQETRELLLNPTQDIESLLQELEVYSSHHGNIKYFIMLLLRKMTGELHFAHRLFMEM